MRPADLPGPDRLKHGTRSRYVAGCRCDACRASNTAYYHQRQREALEALKDSPGRPVAGQVPRAWTAPSGAKQVRVFRLPCPGVDGQPCSAGSYLRVDSKGGVCGRCRERLVWNGLVPAAPARAHLAQLSAQGVGRRSVAAAADVGETTLSEIITGRQLQIRRRAEARILAVDAGAVAGGALVPAGPTWELLEDLLARGFSRRELARRLGSAAKVPALQLRAEFVLASSAAAVARLFRSAGEPPERGSRWRPLVCDCIRPDNEDEICRRCGRQARPLGALRAAVAPDKKVHRIGQAFGFEGGWQMDQRTSRKAKKREEKELRQLARVGGAR